VDPRKLPPALGRLLSPAEDGAGRSFLAHHREMPRRHLLPGRRALVWRQLRLLRRYLHGRDDHHLGRGEGGFG
jgi:hypothetical protein